MKGDDGSVIKEHLLFCNHSSDFKDISILISSLLISRDHPNLNKNKQSLPLEIFENHGAKF